VIETDQDKVEMTDPGWPKCTDFFICNPKIVRIIRIFIKEIHRYF